MSQDAHNTLYDQSSPNPKDQMNAGFSHNPYHLSGFWTEDDADEMDEMLAGDGQKPGNDTNYNDKNNPYGQGGVWYTTPNGEDMYVKTGDRDSNGKLKKDDDGNLIHPHYVKVSEIDANKPEHADEGKFYIDAESGDYVAAIETYNAKAFEDTKDGANWNLE